MYPLQKLTVKIILKSNHHMHTLLQVCSKSLEVLGLVEAELFGVEASSPPIPVDT